MAVLMVQKWAALKVGSTAVRKAPQLADWWAVHLVDRWAW